MNNALDINWLAAIPLGLISLFFFALGLRRGVRFFDHENDVNQKQRFRDLFLSVFDIVSMVFCILLAMSPIKMWLAMIPCGLGLFVFVVPVSMLSSYWRLYVIDGFMPKNAGIRTSLGNSGEKYDEALNWYEFTPFVFIIGWALFFLINIVLLLMGLRFPI